MSEPSENAHNSHSSNTHWFYYLLIGELAAIFFLIPAGRFYGSLAGMEFSVGGDVYKNFPFLAVTWLFWKYSTRSYRLPETPLLLPFSFFLLISLLSSLGSSDPYQAFSETLELLAYCVFYLILIDIPWTKRTLSIVAGAFLLGHIWMGITALNQILTYDSETGFSGINATFNYPNSLGLFSLLSLSILTVIFRQTQSIFNRSCTVFSVGIVLVSAIATMTRATYLGLIAWGGLFVWRWRANRKSIASFVLAGVIVSAIVLPFAGNKLKSTVLELRGYDQSSRIKVWPFVLDFSIQDTPFFGHGKGPVLRDRMDSALASGFKPYVLNRYWKPHNLVMFLFLSMGVFGIFVFGWILLTFWIQTSRCREDIRLILRAGMLAYLVHQLFELHFLDGNIPAVWFTFFALSTYFSEQTADSETEIQL